MEKKLSNSIINLAKISQSAHILELPDLIDTQFSSYEAFLQWNTDPEKRMDHGLQSVFKESFPIESLNEDIVLEFVSYSFGEPKWSVLECKERGVTYAAPLRSVIRLVSKETGEVREQTVYIGDIPLMTNKGTFIINGAERVVVSQLHRSPGIFFFYDAQQKVSSARIIPYRGSWLELEMDAKGILIVRIDRKKKFPATLLLKAIGVGNNEDILRTFYDTELIDVSIRSNAELRKLVGRRTACSVIAPETKEVVVYAGEKINQDTLNIFRELQIKDVEFLIFPMGKDDVTIINCLEKDGANDQSEALHKISQILRPGDPVSTENASIELEKTFFYAKSYDLGRVGRYKINNKFRYHSPENFNTSTRVLRPFDLVMTLRYFVNLVNEVPEYNYDDIDHLGNRRVRSIGELLTNQIKIGFSRMERVVRERMTIQDADIVTPQALISIKPIVAVMNDFFGSSQLSQFMDQTNPLSELTHKRRLNALGPGGLSRDRAGFEVRDVHYSHYGRMCPIETPEGPNIGLIVSMGTYCRVNEYGFLETPYRKVIDSKISSEVEYLTSDIEEHFNIAQASSPLNPDGSFQETLVSCRRRDDFPLCIPEEIHYMDMSPMQIVSVSTALIPFLEHDDANRALMGSNMQRQAVPLLYSEYPLVGTGMEFRAAYDSRTCLLAEEDGVLVKADSKAIQVASGSLSSLENLDPAKIRHYPLIRYQRSNQGTCVNHEPTVRMKQIILPDPKCTEAEITHVGKSYIEYKPLSPESSKTAVNPQSKRIPLKEAEEEFAPLVKTGDRVVHGQNVAGQKISAPKYNKQGGLSKPATVLANGPAVDNKRLALGKNVLVAFMPWEGYNFEDAILMSERIVKDDVFTSVHIEEYEIQARETKLGREIITRDIPNLNDKAFRDLNEDGIIRVGAEVYAGDILVGRVTPRRDVDLSPEYKLLHSIFGDKAREIKDTSLRMPNGTEGVVIGTSYYSSENGDDLPVGVETLVKVFVAKKSHLQVGDKMAGRHGNKGVIARILPEEDMPFMEDGTPIDIILNPLGVPSRMNIGQILESQLGFAAKKLGLHFEVPIFSSFSEKDLAKYMKEAGLPEDCKFNLYDGRTGDKFESKVFCGYIYILKLAHLVDDKIHARSTGPYSLVTQQPLGGKAQFGGQRLGEMEVWALEAYGASHTLQELLTVKSDDMVGRARMYEAIIKDFTSVSSSTPESFNVLMQELRGLALDISLYGDNGERMELSDLEESLNRIRRRSKIKLDSIERE